MGVATDIVAAVELMADRVTAAASLVGSSAITEPTAKNISASMNGVRSDGFDILRTLSTIDDESLAVIDDGEVTVKLWTWRRATLLSVTTLMGQARAIQDLVADFVGGLKQKVIVTREGDTLQKIAARELGDWREWPRLLAANPGLPTGAVDSGLTLIVPEKRRA